jgi:hypothetical protein
MKKLLSVTLALVLCIGAVLTPVYASTVAGADRFKDVDKGAWYYQYIDRLTQEGTVTGDAPDRFSPLRSVSRAEFITMVIRSTVSNTLPEPDNQPHWAQRWMDKAYELGIVTEEEFPFSTWNEPIIRNDMAKVITRTMELVIKEKPVANTDEYIQYIGDWDKLCTPCKPYISQAYAKGILMGINGEFRGTQATSRGEATCVIVRLIDPAYRFERYSDVPFSAMTDVTETGTMKAATAEQFIMKTLENTRYYRENGKYYVSCEYPELPDGFEMIFGTGFEFNNAPVISFRTGAFREEMKIPAIGSFKREITGMKSLLDLSILSLSIAVKAPNANTGNFVKDECTLKIVAVFKNGNLSDFDATMGYTAGGYKDAKVTYGDIFKW